MNVKGVILKEVNASLFISFLVDRLLELKLFEDVIYIYIYIYIWGSLNKFPDFFYMGTFIDSIHMKL